MPKDDMGPPPHTVPARAPWDRPAALPFDDDPGPDGLDCRRCAKAAGEQRLELRRSRDAITVLEELLERFRSENERNRRRRRVAERGLAALKPLLAEFRALATASEQSLEAGRRVFDLARRRNQAARAEIEKERARAGRLRSELLRSKRERQGSRDIMRREILALEQQLVAADAALVDERRRSERHAGYAEALEARLREVGEQTSEPTS